MAKHHKPVAGSRGFWPKKRAKRIYSTVTSHPPAKDAVPLGFAAYKSGMTRAVIFDGRKTSVTHGQEVVRSVTVLECPSLSVNAIRVYKKTPYGITAGTDILAERLSKDLKRKTHLPEKPETKKRLEEVEKDIEKAEDIRLVVSTKPRDSAIGKKTPEVFEVFIGGSIKDKWGYAKQKLGGEIKVEEVFKEGDWIDVKAVTTGKGYQGPVKRFGIKIRSRKNTFKRRHVGSIGSVNVARVLPGKIAMAGQLGFQTRTEYNKRILKIGTDGKATPVGGWLGYGVVKSHYIILDGSVPGPKKRLIMLRRGVRAPDRKDPVEIRQIIWDTQQGV